MKTSLLSCQRRLASILIILALPSLFFGCQCKTQLPIVAITQIVSHPSLDEVHQGVIDELKEQGYVDEKTIRVISENPQGNIATAAQIASSFVNASPKVIVAISTPSAQTAMKAASAKQIPVVFASVTDPLSSKLVSDLKRPSGLVTGTRNAPPIEKELLLIRSVMPAAKTIGMLVNLGEPNSATLVAYTQKAASEQGFQVEVQAVSSSAEVPLAAQNLARRVNAVFLIQDNTVASALASVVKVMNSKKIPIFAAFADAVPAGALAGLAYDEYTIGRQTGKMVARILRGEKAGDISVEDPAKMVLMINDGAAKLLELSIDKSALEQKLGMKP